MGKEELLAELKSYAVEKGFSINSDPKFLDYLLGALLRNGVQKGKRYCPCRVEQTDAFVCPCSAHEQDIEETGHCHCHLFFKA